MRQSGLKSVHTHRAHPTPGVDLALYVHVDQPTPCRVAHDHVQALQQVAGNQPGNALTPQIDRLLRAQRLRQKLATAKMENLDVFSHNVEEAVVALGEVLEHQSVPFSESGSNLVDDRLGRA